VSAAIGVSETLWVGVAAVGVSTAIMLAPRDVRELRAKPQPPTQEALAA
jgi:hypothetical protein